MRNFMKVREFKSNGAGNASEEVSIMNKLRLLREMLQAIQKVQQRITISIRLRNE